MIYDTDKSIVVMGDGEILLKKQEDGNWKGWMQKNGTLIEERQINPEYTLQALLTNDSK